VSANPGWLWTYEAQMSEEYPYKVIMGSIGAACHKANKIPLDRILSVALSIDEVTDPVIYFLMANHQIMKVDVVLDMASLQAQQESQQVSLREETTKELAGPFEFLHE